jgi:hypothetical protein
MLVSSILLLSLSLGQNGRPSPQVQSLAVMDAVSAPIGVLNWRTTSFISCSVKLAPRSGKNVKFEAVVWAFGASDIPASAPNETGRRGSGAAKINPGRIVSKVNLGERTSNFQFNLIPKDFAPTPVGGAAPSKIKEIIDAIQEIGKAGSVRYWVQVVSSDGGATAPAQIQWGEPDPGSKSVNADIQLSSGTPEFPQQTWTKSRTYTSPSGFVIRWQSEPGIKAARLVVYRDSEPSQWALWANSPNQIYTLDIKNPIPGWNNVSVPEKVWNGFQAPTKLKLRVFPLKENGDLYAQGSSTIEAVLEKPSVPVSAPQKETKKLKFTTELIGWEPCYLGAPNDKYRFVVVNTPPKEIFDQVSKVIGKAPEKLDKVYLPPEPPKEKAWYEKVVGAIVTILDWLKEFVTQAPNALKNTAKLIVYNGAGYVSQKVGVKKESFDKVWNKSTDLLSKADGSLVYVPNYILRSPDYLTGRILDDMNVKDPKARAALSLNLRGSIDAWAKEYSYFRGSEVVRGGLAPDPDFQVHTAIAYVRVRTARDTTFPADYREPCPGINLKVGAFSGEAQSLGIPLQYYDLFQSSFNGPTMGQDEEIILAIPMEYHWSHESQKENWLFGYTRNQKTRYSLNGVEKFGESVATRWGKTKTIK